MEILAAVVALETLREPCRVTVHSDSEYVVRAMNERWPHRWRNNGWMRTKNDRAANPDLWQRLLQACERHEITWTWVRGHAGHRENERCDRLAAQAARARELPIDCEYERQVPGRTNRFNF